MKNPYETDAQKVARLREEHLCSMCEAVAIVKRDSLRKRIRDIENLHDVRQVLLEAFPALDEGRL